MHTVSPNIRIELIKHGEQDTFHAFHWPQVPPHGAFIFVEGVNYNVIGSSWKEATVGDGIMAVVFLMVKEC